MDWEGLFVPTHSLIEIVVRGTFMYWVLFLILRFVMQRQTGGIGIADLLVIVLISDAAQNAMSKDYQSITEGTVLVLTIVGWNFALDWLGSRIPVVQRLTRPPAVALVRDGQLLLGNMRREMVTREELMSQLRQQGVKDVSQVKQACLEGDGHISVIRRDGDETGPEEAKVF